MDLLAEVTVHFDFDISSKLDSLKFADKLSLSSDGKDLELKESFFTYRKVPNVWRYNLMWHKANWKLTTPKVGRFIVPKKHNSSAFHDVVIEPSDKNLLLILESPHKDEYEKGTLNPITPAQGASGRNIRDHFTIKVLPILFGLGLKLKKNVVYHLCILNPVPYQTSLFYFRKNVVIKTGKLLKPKIDEPIRNQVWQALFEKTKQDFSRKVVESKSKIIIVACTGNINSENSLSHQVFDSIKALDQLQAIYKTPHPSSWHCMSTFEKLLSKEQ